MKNRTKSLTIADLTPATVQAVAADTGNTGDEVAAQGGAYAGQTFTCIYTIEVTTAGAYGGTGEVTITADNGADRNTTTTVNPVSGVPFAVGSIGVTLSLTDGGDTTLTLGDKWTIKCTGTYELVDSTVVFTHNKVSKTLFPKRIQIQNATGQDMGFNILSSAEEVEEMHTSLTNFDTIEIPNGTTLVFNDFFPLPTPYRIVITNLGVGPGAGLDVELINLLPRN
jgi:hypothetical protein